MNHIQQIQQQLKDNHFDAILITDEKNQRYATGFPFTDGVVIVTQNTAHLITDSRYIEAAEKTVPSSVETVLFGSGKKLVPIIREILSANNIEILGAEEEKLSFLKYNQYQRVLGLSLTPAQFIFNQLRQSKDEDEISSMIQAQRIAEKALEKVLQIIKPGISEREIAAELNYQMMKLGAEGTSFDTISITGTKTSMPHGIPGDELVKAGDFVTMDFGCLKNGYCSDMTRTVAVCSASDKMKNVYDTVLNAQKKALSVAKAGMTGAEIDSVARNVINEAGYGDYFGHSFGHSLGLDIHEAPAASPTNNSPMPVNAVVSAEPGIYIPGEFGVRIEDVMILKENGCEDITLAPKDFTIIGN